LGLGAIADAYRSWGLRGIAGGHRIELECSESWDDIKLRMPTFFLNHVLDFVHFVQTLNARLPYLSLFDLAREA